MSVENVENAQNMKSDDEDVDKENMYHLLRELSNQARDALLLGNSITIKRPKRIFFAGMGGSGVAGELVKLLLNKSPIEVHVVRDYFLPGFASEGDLLFVISYSGNTEETLSCYKNGRKRNLSIITLSSGGKLEEISKKNKTEHIKVKSGIPPRLSTPSLFFPILNVLRRNGIIKISEKEIDNVVAALEIDYSANAKEIMEKIKGRIPLIYASPRFSLAAMKWKTDINENSKSHAFFNIYSEWNHNEINAYDNLKGKFYVIILRDEEEYSRINKRIRVTKSIIKSKGVPVMEINIKGESYLVKLFSIISLGLWVSYFLAIEYGTDPTPVPIIEKLKGDLGPFIG